MDRQMNGKTDKEQTEEWTYRWMDRQNGWTGEGKNRIKDRQIDGLN